MTPSVRPPRRFGRRFLRLLAIARNPLSVIPLLLLRRIQLRADFHVGRLVLTARRTDLGAISEIAIDGEYGFVRQLSFPESGALVLDIGANIGCFSALVLSTWADAEVHSVEPSPDTFALLSENRARCKMAGWHTHQSAIAANTGTLSFHNDGPSTARKLSAFTAGSVLVKTEDFDTFVTRVAGNRRIFICKMDVEGAEVPVFAGEMKTLAQIDHFIVEVHGPAANAVLVTNRLAATFPHVEAIPGRGSAKPMLHAWRESPHDA